MTTRLNSYVLADKVKKKMKGKLYDSRQTKEEMGFTLCSKSDNIIRARGDHKGDSRKIKIDPGACNTDEKFLGGYHTHPGGDSSASIIDLSHCGLHKIICIGGDKDDRIKCQIWKQKQISKEDVLIIAEDIKNNKKQPTNPEHKVNLDCINVMSILKDEEDNLEKMDKDIDKMKSFIPIIKKFGYTTIQDKIIAAVEARDMYNNRLKEEIKNELKKYYNEVEIK